MNKLINAAVLVPVYRDKQGNVRLVLIRRSPAGVHPNQIALPGGKYEEIDSSLRQTALREAEEEIGVSPNDVRIIKALPAVETILTGFRIFPFLAKIKPPEIWRLQESEVTEVLDVKISDLLKPEAYGVELRAIQELPDPVMISFYKIGIHKLWGATFRILNPILDELASGQVFNE
jgi:8-oxo-dGTP pyrophosphatase MutT (NUDIX family)